MEIVALISVDWADLLALSNPLEIIVRGSLTYIALFLLMRFVPKREAGSIGTADLLMVVLIADAAQNAMANNYHSISEGIVLVATIIFWNFLIDWLSYHSPAFRSLVQPKPLVLVKDGRIQLRNMRKELITKEELLGELREHGVDDLTAVKEARIEEDGHISVIKRTT